MANPFFTKLQNNPTCYLRKCKIISTLGVQHSSLESIRALVDAGTDAFRIPIPSDACTIAHLDTMVTNIRQVSEQTGKPLPIIASFHDLDFGIDSGTSKPRALEKGDYIQILVQDDGIPSRNTYRFTDSQVIKKIKEKDIIVVDYGKLVLEVQKVGLLKRSNSTDNFSKLLPKIEEDTDELSTPQADPSPSICPFTQAVDQADTQVTETPPESDSPSRRERYRKKFPQFEIPKPQLIKDQKTKAVTMQQQKKERKSALATNSFHQTVSRTTPKLNLQQNRRFLKSRSIEPSKIALHKEYSRQSATYTEKIWDSRQLHQPIKQLSRCVRIGSIEMDDKMEHSLMRSLGRNSLHTIQEENHENPIPPTPRLKDKKSVLCQVLNYYDWFGCVPCNLIHSYNNSMYESSTSISSSMPYISWLKRSKIEYLLVKNVENDSTYAILEKLFDLKTCPRLIGGINSLSGYQNLDKLIERCSVLVFGRGRISLEIDFASMVPIQKEVVSRCTSHGRLVILCTQFLTSLITNTAPTSSEISDITNAILDGCPALMLLDETRNNAQPAKAVSTLARIIDSSEQHQFRFMDYSIFVHPENSKQSAKVDICTFGAVQYVVTGIAKMICIITHGGFSARQVFKYYPPCPIIAISDRVSVVRQLNLFRGFIPLYMGNILSAEDAFERGFAYGKSLGLL